LWDIEIFFDAVELKEIGEFERTDVAAAGTDLPLSYPDWRRALRKRPRPKQCAIARAVKFAAAIYQLS
jgi:hypothetical protein